MKSIQYEIYRWKWENYPKNGMVDLVPLNIDMEVTTRCNLKCIMCEHSFNPPKPMDLPLDLAKMVITEFAEKGGYSIKFCYLGEPLLYKDLPELIQHAKKKGIIDTIVATNGTLLTSKLSQQLILAGLDHLTVSIDSCQKEVYEKIRINGNFDVVAKNIACLQATKQILKSETPIVRIQGIPMELNEKEIENGEYLNYWSKFADEVRISPYCEDYVLKEVFTNDFFCGQPFQRITLRADGKYALCCGERKDYKIVGDARENTLQQVWLGKRLTEIRRYMKTEKNGRLIPECRTCSYRAHNNEKKEEIINVRKDVSRTSNS